MATTLGDRIWEQRRRRGTPSRKLPLGPSPSKSYVWELRIRTRPAPWREARLDREGFGCNADYLLGVETEVELAEDKAFFRKYQKMTSTQKSQIREMLEIINRKK